MTEQMDIEITRLGAQGDGIAELQDGDLVYVAGALPGERVVIERRGDRGRLRDVVQASPDRIEPVCPHFGSCGGCTSQHMSPASYAAFKLDMLKHTLAQRGFTDLRIEPLEISPPQSRRRAGFKVMRLRDRIILGFNERQSHRLVDVTSCAVLHPDITAFLPALRAFLGRIMGGKVEVMVTRSDSGLDVDITGIKANNISLQMRIAEFAEKADVARITLDGETAIERRMPLVTLGAQAVRLPPRAFLQATVHGERVLQQAVGEILEGCGSVVDLFAGLGTFSLALDPKTLIRACDSDGPSIAALRKAVDLAQRVNMKADARDLFRNPLRANEFKGVEGVILDPPRAGAQAQVTALVTARVPRLAMVSCNPATFARDARILADGGYDLVWLRPVDQFLWSPHIELVAKFVLG